MASCHCTSNSNYLIMIQTIDKHTAKRPMFELRPSTPDDLEFIWQLEKLTMREYVEQTWGEWQDEVQKKRVQENFGLVWHPQIILVKDECAGAYCVERKGENLFISNINILPNYQRQGLGSEIIRSVLEQGQQLNLPVTLRVLKVNPARHLYERLGFKIFEETDTHYMMKAS